MLETSVKMLIGEALSRPRPRECCGSTASHRKSGSSVLVLLATSDSARGETWSVVLGLDDVGGWVRRAATAWLGRDLETGAAGETDVKPLQGIVRVFAIDGQRSEVAAAMLCGGACQTRLNMQDRPDLLR
jgi:hypothetical protein